jgi:hypothetical protein
MLLGEGNDAVYSESGKLNFRLLGIMTTPLTTVREILGLKIGLDINIRD